MKIKMLLAILIIIGGYELSGRIEILHTEQPVVLADWQLVALSSQPEGDMQHRTDFQKDNISEWLSRLNKRAVADVSLSVEVYSRKELLRVRSLDALPFLLMHVLQKRETRYSFGNDPVLETHPYLEAIVVQYGTAGVAAIIEYVARKDENILTDEQLDLFAYGLLTYCGFDKKGRMLASDWINFTEKHCGRTGALNRLREQILLTRFHYR